MSKPKKHELRCPKCNALMYERIVTRGEFKGLIGHGCPLCFFLTPDHLYTDKKPKSKPKSKGEDNFNFWTSFDDEE